MLRAAGIDQRAAMEAGDGVYAVAEVNIRYLRPARLGDDLVIVSTLEQVRAASVLIHQRVMRQAEPLADARVTAAFLGPDDRPRRQPKAWVERFNQLREGNDNLTAPTDMMSPLALFLHADIVVKAVMLGLLAASVWTWAIIFTHAIRLRRINRATEKYEADFWATDDIDSFHTKRGSEKLPTAAILSAGLDEWRRSTGSRAIDRSGTRERLSTRMNAAMAAELDQLGRPAQHPRHGRIGRAVRRPVRHRVGDHARASPPSPTPIIRASRWSRRASPRRCSPPRSACSPPSPRSSPTTA